MRSCLNLKGRDPVRGYNEIYPKLSIVGGCTLDSFASGFCPVMQTCESGHKTWEFVQEGDEIPD
jgi:hypothetical protein